jgi:hypothetical protein
MPGTNLFFRDVTPYFDEEYGWVNIDISGVTITEGSFYIELRFTSTGSNNPFLGKDESSPNDRSFVYNGSS